MKPLEVGVCSWSLQVKSIPELKGFTDRLGINLVMYALCLDYKTDQVHVPFILKRRHWQVEP